MPESLSPREIECVRLAGLGLEDKEIAARLGISPRTVGNHLHRAYVKLKVSDRRLAARRLSNGYSGEPILIPEPAEDGLGDAAPDNRTTTARSFGPPGPCRFRLAASAHDWRSSWRGPPSPSCSPSGS